MSGRARLCGLALLGVLVTACTSVIAGDPQAGPFERDVESELGSTEEADLRSAFNASEQEVNSYWDSDRLNNARPEAPGEGDSGQAAPSDDPLTQAVIADPTTGAVGDVPPDAVGTADDGSVWPRSGLSARTIGRLYYSRAGEPMVCSAAVVNSSSGTLVATAAHCLWDYAGDDGWVQNVLFIPGDDGGDAPHGRWTPSKMYAPPQFIDSASIGANGGVVGEGWGYDFGFMRMRPQDGETIQQALGAQGIAFGEQADGLVVVGYPSTPPFDGSTMRYCAAPNWTSGAYGTYSIPCTMTPGSSGGPWFTRFDPDAGAGYLVATTSTVGTHISGSQFHKAARDLYDQADAGD